MRRNIAVAAGLVVAALLVGLVVVLVTLHRMGADRDRGIREARARITVTVDTYARQILGISPTPAGPPESELAAISERAGIGYVRDQPGGVFRSLTVIARDSYPAPMNGGLIQACSTIEFRGLGTAGAAYAVHPLPDCREVIATMAGQTPTPQPTR
jgi:hypothetical protein